MAVRFLTARERGVLLLLGGALGKAAIGLRLGIGERTVKKHVAVLDRRRLCAAASDPQGLATAMPTVLSP